MLSPAKGAVSETWPAAEFRALTGSHEHPEFFLSNLERMSESFVRISPPGGGTRHSEREGEFMLSVARGSGRVCGRLSSVRIVMDLGLLSLVMVLACAGLVPGVAAAPSGSVPTPPLYLADSTLDPDNLSRIFVVDPASGALTLRADLGTTSPPVTGL